MLDYPRRRYSSIRIRDSGLDRSTAHSVESGQVKLVCLYGRRWRLTHVGEVVHEDDLLEQVGRRAVEHGVDSPQQDRPGLIVEADDHSGRWQLLQVAARFLTPANETTDVTSLRPLHRAMGLTTVDAVFSVGSVRSSHKENWETLSVRAATVRLN
jgi:hypothetical protein